MKTVVIVAHPDLAGSQTQQFLHESLPDAVIWHDLTAVDQVGFDRQAELKLLSTADRIVLQFPLYWYSAPFILKKWQDTVFSGEINQYDWLKNKELAVVVAIGQPVHDYQGGTVINFSLTELLRPYQAFAQRLGWRYLSPLIIERFAYLDLQTKQQLLIRYQQYLTMTDANDFIAQGDWLVTQLQGLKNENSEGAKQVQLIIDEMKQGVESYQTFHQQINEIRKGEVD